MKNISKSSNKKVDNIINIKNRKAYYEYHFIDTYTAGIVLTGTEIKSIRNGEVSIKEAYCIFLDNELWVRKMHIAQYIEASYNNHEPTRERKLLLSKKELKKLLIKSEDKGLTIIPVRFFINNRGYAKLDIVLAKGKKLYDKRENIKERDMKREMERERSRLE